MRADLNWGIPFNLGIPVEWRGGLAVTGKNGNEGFGNATKPETRLFTELLAPVADLPGLMVGVDYEMWRNKYGANQMAVPGATVLMIKAHPVDGLKRYNFKSQQFTHRDRLCV